MLVQITLVATAGLVTSADFLVHTRKQFCKLFLPLFSDSFPHRRMVLVQYVRGFFCQAGASASKGRDMLPAVAGADAALQQPVLMHELDLARDTGLGLAKVLGYLLLLHTWVPLQHHQDFEL